MCWDTSVHVGERLWVPHTYLATLEWPECTESYSFLAESNSRQMGHAWPGQCAMGTLQHKEMLEMVSLIIHPHPQPGTQIELSVCTFIMEKGKWYAIHRQPIITYKLQRLGLGTVHWVPSCMPALYLPLNPTPHLSSLLLLWETVSLNRLFRYKPHWNRTVDVKHTFIQKSTHMDMCHEARDDC